MPRNYTTRILTQIDLMTKKKNKNKKIIYSFFRMLNLHLNLIPAISLIIGTHLCCTKEQIAIRYKRYILLRKGTIKNKIK